MPAQIGYFDTLKSVAGKVFSYLASITLTGTDGKTITVTENTSLDEPVAMSDKAPKASPSFTTVVNVPASHGTAEFALDITTDAFLGITADATANPFGADNNFSGLMIIMEIFAVGESAVFLVGYIPVVVSQTATLFSATKDTASKINIYLEGGVVIIQNKTAGTIRLRIMAFRTRPSS